jgi:hypothetical protein
MKTRYRWPELTASEVLSQAGFLEAFPEVARLHTWYEKIKFAHGVLESGEYLPHFAGRGDFIEYLRKTMFVELEKGGQGGTIFLLLQAFEANPNEAIWKKHNYDLQIMSHLGMNWRNRLKN